MLDNTTQIRNNLIGKLMTIGDEKLLKAIDQIIDSSFKNKHYKISDLQKEYIIASEEDIKYDRITSDDDVNEEEDKWLSE